MESFKISEIFPVMPETIYKAWLDSDVHSDIIGSNAEIDPKVDGKFKIWEDYISGTTIELVPNKKIVQRWRTNEFPEGSPDSLLELIFEEVKGGTRLTLLHSEIPDGQSQGYKEGWKEFYFEPMLEYFS
jgi:uncharacterized protein YndB with AHSA1/START domain